MFTKSSFLGKTNFALYIEDKLSFMNQKKVSKLLSEIKNKLAELEIELSKNETDKDYLRTRYNIITKKGILGGKKGLTKIAVFENIITLEAPHKTLDQLNTFFSKSQFPSLGGFATYDYIISESNFEKATKDVQRKYSKIILKTTDKKNIKVFNQWASFENIEKQTPGNFPVLQEIAKTLGYEILPVD